VRRAVKGNNDRLEHCILSFFITFAYCITIAEHMS
jgi:hypothetical protein